MNTKSCNNIKLSVFSHSFLQFAEFSLWTKQCCHWALKTRERVYAESWNSSTSLWQVPLVYICLQCPSLRRAHPHLVSLGPAEAVPSLEKLPVAQSADTPTQIRTGEPAHLDKVNIHACPWNLTLVKLLNDSLITTPALVLPLMLGRR